MEQRRQIGLRGMIAYVFKDSCLVRIVIACHSRLTRISRKFRPRQFASAKLRGRYRAEEGAARCHAHLRRTGRRTTPSGRQADVRCPGHPGEGRADNSPRVAQPPPKSAAAPHVTPEFPGNPLCSGHEHPAKRPLRTPRRVAVRFRRVVVARRCAQHHLRRVMVETPPRAGPSPPHGPARFLLCPECLPPLPDRLPPLPCKASPGPFFSRG